MSVVITIPQNDGDPLSGSWTATATYNVNDAVDGVLLDLRTNEVYPSNNPNYVFDSGTGVYTWTIPFQHDGDIHQNDSLYLDCYDAETGDNDGTRTAVASQVGYTGSSTAAPRKGAAPTTPPSIKIDPATSLSGTTLTVIVRKTKGVKGGVRVTLVNRTTGINRVRHHQLSENDENWRHPFENIDPSQWAHIHVIAVIKHHKGTPDVKKIKGD